LNAGTAKLLATRSNCMAVFNLEMLVGASWAETREASKYRDSVL